MSASSDKLFQRKRARGNLQRPKGGRYAPAARILAVCEGKKTEPVYIRDMVKALGLTAVEVDAAGGDVCIVPGDVSGTDPLSIVNYGARRKHDDDFQDVFCVFDRDRHSRFDDALTSAKRSGLRAIPSWPCFEVWLLMHFEDVSACFDEPASRTPKQNVITRLKAFPGLARYTDAMPGVYALLETRCEGAISTSKRVAAARAREGRAEPSTRMHELVEFLRDEARRCGAEGPWGGRR